MAECDWGLSSIYFNNEVGNVERHFVAVTQCLKTEKKETLVGGKGGICKFRLSDRLPTH